MTSKLEDCDCTAVVYIENLLLAGLGDELRRLFGEGFYQHVLQYCNIIMLRSLSLTFLCLHILSSNMISGHAKSVIPGQDLARCNLRTIRKPKLDVVYQTC